jgi:hypothetical protein
VNGAGRSDRELGAADSIQLTAVQCSAVQPI